MKEVTRYKCDHCEKLAARPSTIAKHEPVCVSNPEGKNCFNCVHQVSDYSNERGEHNHECDLIGGECTKYRALECDKFERVNHEVLPPVVEEGAWP
ncbi:hypothetical protein [Paenibacillus sp. MMO-58]|uniref:hypothetical protein n=1 Tax=Paenibacillus sp. MMO-58 TaxID=3081290 RepID=UPI003016A08A